MMSQNHADITKNEAITSLKTKGRKTALSKNEAVTLLKKNQLQEIIEMRFYPDKVSAFRRAENPICSSGIGTVRMKIPG